MWPEPISLKRHDDKRGSFMEIERDEPWKVVWKQTSYSLSHKHVLRGLHYRKPEQNQLVTVLRGTIFEVVVDLQTGKHETYELGDLATFQQILIPPGFAHGYCTLEKSQIIYQADKHYKSTHEYGIRWNDPQLKIEWPIKDPIISDRDKKLPLWHA